MFQIIYYFSLGAFCTYLNDGPYWTTFIVFSSGQISHFRLNIYFFTSVIRFQISIVEQSVDHWEKDRGSFENLYFSIFCLIKMQFSFGTTLFTNLFIIKSTSEKKHRISL